MTQMHDSEMTLVCGVMFARNDGTWGPKVYTYTCPYEVIPGMHVMVPVGAEQEVKQVRVVTMRAVDNDEINAMDYKLSGVIRVATQEEKDALDADMEERRRRVAKWKK